MMFTINILAVLVSVVFSKILRIDHGILNGTILTSRDGKPFHAFYGIPYAAPPIGILRFAPPAPPAPWNGIREAKTKPPVCSQVSLIENKYIGSEDCLYINVFTTKIKPKKLLPVLVYLHRGSFRFGNGDMNGPHLFMDESVVFVSFNFRLGVFGFLSSGDDVIPGNYGLKDQVMALKWIQQNIKRFGGNPKFVTLIGQNSGATSVHLHTFSTLSRGLFRNVIIQSGNAFKYITTDTSKKTKKVFVDTLQQLNCTKSSTQESLACLRTLADDHLNKANQLTANNNLEFIKYEPVIENSNIEDAFLRTTDYQLSTIPAIFGLNSAEGLNEAAKFLIKFPNITKLNERLNEDLPTLLRAVNIQSQNVSDLLNRIKNFYFSNDRMEVGQEQNLSNLIGDTYRIINIMRAMKTYPGEKYLYVYDYKNQFTSTRLLFNDTRDFGIKGAAHSDELYSLFTCPGSDKLSAEDEKLSKRMIKYWSNFITCGNPNKPKIVDVRWRPVKEQAKFRYLHITNKFRLKSNPLAERLKFWGSLLNTEFV